MSLDVTLTVEHRTKDGRTGIYVREDGRVREITRDEWDARFPGLEPVIGGSTEDEDNEVYWRNITHNLARMADAAGLYEALWQPNENGYTYAGQLVEPLESGLKRLEVEPDYYKTYNPENGWGSYEGLIDFVRSYLRACEQYPHATISASR